jgi:hypothetical protein
MRMPTKIVLDPSGAYKASDDCIAVQTEVDWIQYVGRGEAGCWVKGQHLCQWTKEWLKAWQLPASLVEEREFPRVRLQAFLKQVPVPNEWTQEQILGWLTRLEEYGPQLPIAHLLADACPMAGDLWMAPPSSEHLARWLGTELPPEYRPFEDCWREEVASRCEGELADGYRTAIKLDLLRRWLLIGGEPLRTLGVFPAEVPTVLAPEFTAYWARQLTTSSGAALDVINPAAQSGMAIVAREAYEAFRRAPSWVTPLRLRKIASWLKGEQVSQLAALIPPEAPPLLPSSAGTAEALRWATHGYLPYRRWVTTCTTPNTSLGVTEALAESFVAWLLTAYPALKLEPVNRTVLNYSVTSLVLDLVKQGPVLWAVVDGMGWLEQCQLIDILSAETDLRIVSGITPRLSVLPTRTEYAKWALYAQLLPADGGCGRDIAKGFTKISLGRRYTDTPNRREALMRDLQQASQPLYCWDTTEFDALYHSEVNWEQLVRVSIPQTLRKIAHQIAFYVRQHPRPRDLSVVLCSDHGQMMGSLPPLDGCSEGFVYGGRLTVGRVPDPRFVVLEAGRFGLPHDVSVVRGSGFVSAFHSGQDGSIVGTHGGLFPEEVVVGVSVLRYGLPHRPVIAACTGTGKPRQEGEISMVITNPNEVPLTGVCLYVDQLRALRAGRLLDIEVPASSTLTWRGAVQDWPELPVSATSNKLSISGCIAFRFADAEEGSAPLDEGSQMTIEQIFRSGMDIDEFL